MPYMGDAMRLFIAVMLHDNMQRALLDAQAALRRRSFGGKYTDRQSMHLTLCFIGEYPDPDFVLECMEQIPYAPFPLTLSGRFGSFGDLLWAGTEQEQALKQYAARLRHVLADNRIPFDKQHFHPHITLLRHASGSQPFSDIVIARETMTVSGISLMRSDIGKHGAHYTELGTVPCI